MEFYFGAALSAHQSEGNNLHSDWWDFENRILSKRNIAPSGNASKHFEFFTEDFKLATELGHNAHRFSIEWAKIEPLEGQIDYKMIEHYHQVFSSLEKNKLTPFVTLFHFSLPKWFADKGGFYHFANIKYFENYCKLIATEFREELEYVFTINEPEVYSYNCYMSGNWPPQKKSFFAFHRVYNNLMSAHHSVYYAMKAIAPDIKIGVAKNNQIFKPDRIYNPLDYVLSKYLKYVWNYKFLKKTKHCLDFIGLNYYFYRCVKFGFRSMNSFCQLPYPTTRKSDLQWEVYPKGIYILSKELFKKFKLPIIISEHGVADKLDHLRQEILKEGFYWLEKSIDEGVPLFGYLHWALLDNYEWENGFEPRFGLIKVDYENYARTIRPSGLLYRNLILDFYKKYDNVPNLNNNG